MGEDKDSAGSDMAPSGVPMFQRLLLNFLDTKAPTLGNFFFLIYTGLCHVCCHVACSALKKRMFQKDCGKKNKVLVTSILHLLLQCFQIL